MKKIFFILFSIVLVASLAACGAKEAKEPIDESNAREVVIIATDWEFDKEEYVVKKGEVIKLTLDNQKGVHGIEVDGYKSVNLSPSKKSVVFVADKAGTFKIKCSINCGAGHSTMISNLVVQD